MWICACILHQRDLEDDIKLFHTYSNGFYGQRYFLREVPVRAAITKVLYDSACAPGEANIGFREGLGLFASAPEKRGKVVTYYDEKGLRGFVDYCEQRLQKCFTTLALCPWEANIGFREGLGLFASVPEKHGVVVTYFDEKGLRGFVDDVSSDASSDYKKCFTTLASAPGEANISFREGLGLFTPAPEKSGKVVTYYDEKGLRGFVDYVSSE
ncbi:hypothetical protein CEXT_773601 [Caerostris extrusa]|uniref:Uncharacterized protein n=1 Tax=Caerostris extrusa TaxID=172846 RepID=A0AAV4PE11_CAEEX|nr:hypothetical protein CEXT_773601 [Caerostris extrusa]